MVQFNPNLNVGPTVGLAQAKQTSEVADSCNESDKPAANKSNVYYVGDGDFTGMKPGDYVIGRDGKAHKVFIGKDGDLCWKNRGGRNLTTNFLLNNCSNEGGLTWSQAMNLRDSF